MKRIPVIVAVLMALVLCSCSNSPNEDIPNAPIGSLRLVSEVKSIRQEGVSTTTARVIDDDGVGDPIIGVIIKYGDQDDMGLDESTFYLKYEGDGKTAFNGDDKEYNYTLYVPQIILTEYGRTGQEANHQQGKAFWWYAGYYLGLSYESVTADWYPTLTYMLEHADELPVPDAADFPGADWDGIRLEDLEEQLKARPIVGVKVEYESWPSEHFTLKATDEDQVDNNGSKYNYVLACSNKVCDLYYLAGCPGLEDMRDPLEWYLSTHLDLNVTLDGTSAKGWKEVFAKLLSLNAGTPPGFDIEKSEEAEVSSDQLQAQLEEYPVKGVIVDADGDDFKLFHEWTIKFNGDGDAYNYLLRYPSSILDAFKQATGKDGTGNAFWWYTEEYLHMTQDEIKADWEALFKKVLSSDVLIPGV